MALTSQLAVATDALRCELRVLSQPTQPVAYAASDLPERSERCLSISAAASIFDCIEQAATRTCELFERAEREAPRLASETLDQCSTLPPHGVLCRHDEGGSRNGERSNGAIDARFLVPLLAVSVLHVRSRLRAGLFALLAPDAAAFAAPSFHDGSFGCGSR